jgi:hypothetical protein
VLSSTEKAKPPVPVVYFVPLDTAVEFNRWCQTCLDRTLFVADKECAYGLIGECAKCGEKSVAPFTRTPSEVA